MLKHHSVHAYSALHTSTNRPKKHCHNGLFCEANSESLAPNNLASNRTTARRSSPSLLCEQTNTFLGKETNDIKVTHAQHFI